jgi:hypothetical protein
MSFWGLSKTGKEAQGWSRESGAINKQQFKDSLADKKKFQDRGDYATDWGTNYWKNRADRGLPSTQTVRATGQEIMPDLAGVKKRTWGRLDDTGKGWNTANAAINQKIGQMETANTDEQKAVGGYIDSTYGGNTKREGAAHDFVIGDAYDTYGNLGEQTGNAYSDMAKRVELLNPAGEASTARMARSFAPALASVNARLRRGGIDANSLQGISATRNVETDRARAMDDAAAAGTAGYVSAANQLRTGELDRQTDLERERSGIARGETIRNVNAANANATAQGQANIQNQENWYNRGTGLTQQRIQQDLTDYGQDANLNAIKNQQENTDLGLQVDQFNQGAGYVTANENAKDRAASEMTNIGQNAYNNSFNAGQQALAFNQAANQGYGTAYQQEAANAGWGKKGILGLAGAGLNMVAPGAGTLFTGAMGGSYGAPGGSGGGWGGGSPFQLQNPFAGNGSGSVNYNYWNPSKTTTLPDGSLQVGR